MKKISQIEKLLIHGFILLWNILYETLKIQVVVSILISP